jgi:hypothetical protein
MSTREVYILSIYLSIYPSIDLSIYLFICLFIYLSICLSVYLSIYGSTANFWILAAFSVSYSYTQSVGLLGRGISPSKVIYKLLCAEGLMTIIAVCSYQSSTRFFWQRCVSFSGILHRQRTLIEQLY